MKKIKLVLPIEQEDRFLKEIGRLGILQVKAAEKRPLGFNTDVNIAEERRNVLNLIRRCDAILNKLPKEGIIAQLIGKDDKAEPITEEQEVAIYDNAQRILSDAEDRLDKWDRLKKLKLSIRKQVSSKMSSLLRDNMIVLGEVKKTDYMVIMEGWIKRKDIDRLMKIVSEVVRDNCLMSLEEPKLLGKEILIIRIATLATYFSILEGALSSYGVAKFLGEEEKEELKARDVEEAIDLSSVKQEITILKKVLLKRFEVLKIKENIARSESFAYLEGWVKEKDIEKLVSIFEKSDYKHELSIEEPEEWEDPPVALENPPLIRSFELLTLMYGTPGYRQIDPTPLLALTYSLFFGLMFADVFDGLLLLVFSLLLYRGLGSRSRNGRKLSEILISISLSSMFFGFLTGEFMGGVVKIPVLWFNGFEDPMYFLQITIILGIIQLTVGFVIGFINELLARRLRNAIGEKISWLLLLYGSVIVFLYLYFLRNEIYLYLGSILSISGLALLIVANPRNLIEITRLMSNLISYSRIVAINMSHIGISRAFALLATPLIYSRNPFIGILLGGAILLVAHLFLVFIESFIAFSHSLRLHLVEFFSKFFEHMGNIFKPLSLDGESIEGR